MPPLRSGHDEGAGESSGMIITVASGKGGTGKTTIATNLAVALNRPLTLLDCDVEEPNAHLFLRPEMTERFPFEVAVPEIIMEKCTLCGKCQELCQFNALAVLPQTVLLFPELCHSCGGCSLICPEQAVVEGRRVMGEVERGRRGQIAFVHGRLRVGEAMAPPLIRRVPVRVAGLWDEQEEAQFVAGAVIRFPRPHGRLGFQRWG